MAVTFDLPTDIEQNLRHVLGDLDGGSQRGCACRAVRQDTLTQDELFDRAGADTPGNGGSP